MCVSLLGYLSVNVFRLVSTGFQITMSPQVMKMVVKVKIGDEKHNLSDLLDWLNDILQATFSQVEHTCSGIFVTRLIENVEC